jgi:hypothetical protein
MFRIPDYQRGYAWRRRQVLDLLEDIDEVIDSGLIHYTGTIVAAWNQEEGRYDVVDGQQRLTTLVIVLCRLLLMDGDHRDWIRYQFIETDDSADAALRLNPNYHIEQHFRQRVVKDSPHQTPEYQSHRNIDTAVEVVDRWLRERDPDTVAEVIANRLYFILFAPDSTKEIGIMFEVINNRGKALSQLEKIKNYFIYFATVNEMDNVREQVNTKWSELLLHLNHAKVHDIDEEDRFLRYAFVVFFGASKEDSWEVYENLKEAIPATETPNASANAETVVRFVQFLVDASQYYAYLRNTHYVSQQLPGPQYGRMRRILKYIRCHYVTASIMPLYLAIVCRSDISLEEKGGLLELLEKLNFRVYVLPKVTSRADSRQAHLFSLAAEFYASTRTISSLKSELVTFIHELCSVRTFIAHLTIDEGEEEDYNAWQGKKYFLGRYEEKLQAQVNNADWDIEKVLREKTNTSAGSYLSIEHLWARQNRTEDYPEDQMQKRRLGNLVLMEFGKNVQLSNDDPDTKIDALVDVASQPPHSKLEQVRELHETFKPKSAQHGAVAAYDRRTKGYIYNFATVMNDLRETALVRFALDNWHVEGDDTSVFLRVDSFEEKSNGDVVERDSVTKYVLQQAKAS